MLKNAAVFWEHEKAARDRIYDDAEWRHFGFEICEVAEKPDLQSGKRRESADETGSLNVDSVRIEYA